MFINLCVCVCVYLIIAMCTGNSAKTATQAGPLSDNGSKKGLSIKRGLSIGKGNVNYTVRSLCLVKYYNFVFREVI